jgi:hypothetical protein
MNFLVDRQILLVGGFNDCVPPKTKNAYREFPYAYNTPHTTRSNHINHTHPMWYGENENSASSEVL